MHERGLLFGLQAAQVGVLNSPPGAAEAGAPAIFLSAGLTHHVGPNRLHVQLARALAAQGVASLRLDFSGIGDSPPRADYLPIFDLVRREPVEAMDTLAGLGFSRFVLVGLCSGAYSAFHVACNDTRVVGAVVINPEDLAFDGSTPASEAGGHPGAAWRRRYWTHSLFRPRAWLNLLSGRVNYRRLVETLTGPLRGRGAKAAQAEADACIGLRAGLLQALQARPLRMLFISSGDDVSREYLDGLLDAATLAQAPAGRLDRLVIERCDHLFTRLEDQVRLRDAIVPWVVALGLERAAG